MRGLRKGSLLTTVAALAVSCGKKDDTNAAKPESLEDLQLSGSLDVEVPASMSKAGGTTSTALSLLAGKRSSEACRVMTETDRVFQNLLEMKSMFCHLEVESEKMKFGTKYNVEIIGGGDLTEQAMALWVDNSDESNLKVYMCKNGSLKQSFNISGFAGEKGLVKGALTSSFNDSHEGTTFDGGINMEFDFTTKGVKLVAAQMSNTMSGGQFSGSFKNSLDVAIRESGLSKVLMSNVGSQGNSTFGDQGAMLFDGTTGQALFTGSGSFEGQSYSFTSRSTFDSDGNVVAKSQASAEVTVDPTILPTKLESSFAAKSPSGWDCSGADETIVVDMTEATKGAAHAACDISHDNESPECWGDDFAFGDHE